MLVWLYASDKALHVLPLSMLIGNTNTCYCSYSVDWTVLAALLLMILTQILINTIYNTLCDSNHCCSKVVVHRFNRKELHSLTSACMISTFSVRIETAAIVFNRKKTGKGLHKLRSECHILGKLAWLKRHLQGEATFKWLQL